MHRYFVEYRCGQEERFMGWSGYLPRREKKDWFLLCYGKLGGMNDRETGKLA
jgi:hypothetical protein